DGVRKWNKDILIYLPNAPDQVLQEILNEVIDEINFLSETISLRLVNSVERSNFILFFGSGEDYVKQWEPSAANLIASNRGLFSIDYNSSSYEIVSGNAWIDVTLVADYACLKHLLREEMTQSLGMINDIYSDQESIFYGNYRCFTDYTARDKVFIAEFMSEKIKPGQCISQVLERITID
ncbi:MAG: DUF2927 domain-containing protein, partial [Algoriphagus sp.]|uniref:DUF2927 domain-containing protein n=1 Tax=Algoriphagus sp. TaxID=1872435 RepID=UPI003299D214